MKSVYGVGGVPGVGSSAAMDVLLASQQFLMADFFSFTLADGSFLRYTNADGNLTILGSVYSAVGPLLTRGPTRTIIGVEVDTLEVNFLVNSTVQINSIPIAQFAAQGGFDGARLGLGRVFMPVGSWGDVSAGYLIQFVGRVAEVVPTRSNIKVSVNSDLELLNILLPRNLYQSTCVHTLFDAGCTLVKSTFAAAGATTVLAGSTTTLLNCGLAQAAQYFDQGTVTINAGVLSGLTRTVKSYVPGAITLAYPLPSVPANGTAFTAYPGCDKLQATCTNKFSNLSNFRGFPFIPVAEASY